MRFLLFEDKCVVVYKLVRHAQYVANLVVSSFIQQQIDFFFFFFLREKKGTCVWQSLSHALWYSWVSSWVPPARTRARKLRTHTHPRLYWFLGLLEIAITILVRTRNWDVVKSQ